MTVSAVTGIDARIAKLLAKRDYAQQDLQQRKEKELASADLDSTRDQLERLSEQRGFVGNFNRGKANKVNNQLKDKLQRVSFNDLLGSMDDVLKILKTPFGESVVADLDTAHSVVHEELAGKQKTIEDSLDTSDLDSTEQRLTLLQERKRKIDEIKASDSYKALLKAKAQKEALSKSETPLSKEVEELHAASIALARELEQLNNLTDSEITEDSLLLLDTLSTAQEAANKAIEDKETKLFAEVERVDAEIAQQQMLVEKQVRTKLSGF
jgi:hypothetical protein